MGSIVAGFATSHAFTFMDPGEWDRFRERNRESFRRRRGTDAPIHPKIAEESIDDVRTRFKKIRAAHDALRTQIRESRPDVMIVIGDDQNEIFVNGTIPQVAVYSGKDFTLSPRFTSGQKKYRSHPDFAEALIERGMDEGFDVAIMVSFAGDVLESHAHAQVLDALLPAADTPVVPVYVNAIHHPAPGPQRCYEFGRVLRRVIEARPASERVAICASGGLSHFTAGYPWDHYNGPYYYGAISEEFDRQALAAIERGEGETLARLSSDDLLAHGDIELRTWIVLLGAMGGSRPKFAIYEPFYRAIMGMAVASWPAAAT